MKSQIVFLVFSILTWSLAFAQLNNGSFPDDFLFGTATAAYQVEGAWNESDKSESIWDYLTHNYPSLVIDESNGDVACDSYHKIDEDVALLKNLGVDFYRFSISWPRVLPTGFSNKVNEAGIAYYNNLIDALVAANITPMATVYHWDLPNVLQKLGGWTNPKMADYYLDYANICFKYFGDRIKYWITFNEPTVICSSLGGSLTLAPANVDPAGIGIYLCVDAIMKAHAKAYHLYNNTYRSIQNGQIGITNNMFWYEANSSSTKDVEAQIKQLQFSGGLYSHPIFSKEGDYPEVVKQAVAKRSALEGFPYSRLPELTSDEIEYIKGTADFFGLNHYSTYMVAHIDDYEIGEPSLEGDVNVKRWFDPSWEGSASYWLKVVPWGFRKLLGWLHDEYGYPIFVTENGVSDYGGLDDYRRVNYYQVYLSALLDSLEDGVNVIGYTAWTLMDNFEWLDGYVCRFGLHHVNMSDPERTRIIKKSGEYYKQVIATKTITQTTESDDTSGSTSIFISSTYVIILLLVKLLFNNI